MLQISFIIPVYNLTEDEVTKCITSIADQTVDRSAYEIIIVDDGSNNGIEHYCDFLGRKYNAKVIHQSNQGLAIARNTGIAESQGEWIVHVDGDDWIHTELAESLLAESHDESVSIIVWGYYLQNGKSRRELLLKDKNAFENDYSGMKDKILCSILGYDSSFASIALNTSWGKAYRRDFIFKNGLIYDSSLRRAQDVVYNLYAFYKAEGITYIDKALSFYRADNVSLSRGFNPKNYDYLRLTAMAVRSFASNNELSNRVRDASYIFVQRCFRMINEQYYQHKDNTQSYRDRKKQFVEGIETEPFKEAFSTGLKRNGFINWWCDFFYEKKMFGTICIMNTLISVVGRIRRSFIN